MPREMTPARAFQPDYTSAPGETLADLLEQTGMTQTELSQRLGVSLKHVNQVVKGTASISAELALGLEKVLGVSAAFWLTRESLYRADLARREETQDLTTALEWAKSFPVRELRQRGFIAPATKGTDLVRDLLGFFGIASPDVWTDPPVAFRKSQRVESDAKALAAWLRVGEIEAATIDVEPFDSRRFHDVLHEARGLTRLDPSEWHPALVRTCASAGVAVVITEAFRGARANGATRWLSPTKALIQMSLRYRWEDIFWFSFFHEAAHVLMHRKKQIFLEGLEATSDAESQVWEDEADRFATRTLIPLDQEPDLRQLTLTDVPEFADRLGIDAGIVIGRLQHDGLMPNHRGNELRHRLSVSD